MDETIQPAAAPAPEVAPAPAPEVSAPEAPEAEAPKLSMSERLLARIEGKATPRGPDGKFLKADAAPAAPQAPEAAPAAEAPAPVVTEPKYVPFEPLGIEVPEADLPKFQASWAQQETRRQQEAQAAERQRVESEMARMKDEMEQREALLELAKVDYDAFYAIVNSPAMRGQPGVPPAAIPPHGGQPQQQPGMPQPRYLTEEDFQKKLGEVMAAREKEAQDKAAAMARVQHMQTQLTNHFAEAFPESQYDADTRSILEEVTAFRFQKAVEQGRLKPQGLPDDLFMAAVSSFSNSVRQQFNRSLASRKSAQADLVRQAPPPMVGGGTQVPKKERPVYSGTQADRANRLLARFRERGLTGMDE